MGFRNGCDAKDVMYSDYFDAPDNLSEEIEGDGKDSEDNMDDSDKDSDDGDNERKVASNKLNISHDDDNDDSDDNAPKSTLEKQQEKV